MSRVYDVAFRNAVTGAIVHINGHGNTKKTAKRVAMAHLVRRLELRPAEGDVADYVFNSIRFKAQR